MTIDGFKPTEFPDYNAQADYEPLIDDPVMNNLRNLSLLSSYVFSDLSNTKTITHHGKTYTIDDTAYEFGSKQLESTKKALQIFSDNKELNTFQQRDIMTMPFFIKYLNGLCQGK